MPEARALLAEPNHCIPTITEIKKSGRRVQDKNLLSTQMDEEARAAQRLRREKVTAEQLLDSAHNLELGNDQLLKMGNERLVDHEKLVQMSTQTFWNDVSKSVCNKSDSSKVKANKWMTVALNSMTEFRRVVFLKKRGDGGKFEDIRPQTKKEAKKLLDLYLHRVKRTSELIIQYLYGKDTKQYDRLICAADLLHRLHFFVLDGESAWDHVDNIPPASLQVLQTFTSVDTHYSSFIRGNDSDSIEDDLNPNMALNDTTLDNDSDQSDSEDEDD